MLIPMKCAAIIAAALDNAALLNRTIITSAPKTRI
jgi:hypothetical protein